MHVIWKSVLLSGACAVGGLVSCASAQMQMQVQTQTQTQTQTPPELTLTRFADCGTPQAPTEVNLRFSDTWAYPGLKVPITYSCYLIRHGDEYMVWDTGQPLNGAPVAPKTTLPAQLAQLNLKPEQIKYVGISHYHNDHTGQAAAFTAATLLIGKGDWEALKATPPPGDTTPLTRWISGGGKVEPVALDKDVFGDGSVIMLATPGHTPGHHSLLVKLRDTGPVVLSGDFVHFRENYDTNGVPSFNTSRAETLASIDRVKKIAANLKATVVIQHDARDVDKLPAFPAFAK